MNTGTAAHIANIYAHGLLDLADQARVVETVSADLDALSTLLAQEPDFRAFLASPYFTEQVRHDLVRRVFAGKLHRLTLNFLAVVIDHDRGALLPEITDRFKQLHRACQGYQTVKVTVAHALSEEELGKLARDLAGALNTKVDLDAHVDPSIGGGVIIRYGENMLDNSVRGRLLRTVHHLTHPEKRQR